jgi:uncharacterized protein (DUF305 family)
MTTTTRRRRLAAAGTVLALSAGLTACAGGTEATAPAAPAQSPAASPEEPAAPSATDDAATSGRDDADVAFVRGMLAHHRGALDIAEVAVRTAATTQVAALADRIADERAPQIDQMSEWLATRGEEVASGSGHEGSAGTEDGSTDSADAVAELEELSGTDADRRFLELMIEHHREAIAMSEAELAEGRDPDAQELARLVIDDRTAEITEMETLLDGL